MKGKAQEPMVLKGFKLRREQIEFLEKYRQEGGNPSQLIRIGLDNEIARRQTLEGKTR